MYSCLCAPSESRLFMLYKGVPIGIKYRVEPMWNEITPLQKNEFFEALYEAPHAWTPVPIDRLRGERFYPFKTHLSKKSTTIGVSQAHAKSKKKNKTT